MNYVSVTIGNRNFFTGKQVIVKVEDEFTFITTYRDEAFKIACEHLGLNKEECSILDWSFLGSEVTFII